MAGKKAKSASAWVKCGLRVLGGEETTQFMRALQSCVKAGCMKDKHLFVGFNQVSRRLEHGDVVSIAIVKSYPIPISNYLVEAAAMRNVNVVMLPTDSATKLASCMGVSSIKVLAISGGERNGENGSKTLKIKGSSSSPPSRVCDTSTMKRLGISRSTPLSDLHPSVLSYDSAALLAGEGGVISATLDGLNDLSARLTLV